MRSSVRKITGKLRCNDRAELLTIVFGCQFFCFHRIGQESTLNENPGTGDMVQKIDPLPFFDHPSASGIQYAHQSRLELLGQGFTSGSSGIENLRTAVAAVGKVVLMDAYENSTGGFACDFNPLFQIGHLFLGEGLPSCIDSCIRAPDQCRVIAK